jgi:hypothetical protein
MSELQDLQAERQRLITRMRELRDAQNRGDEDFDANEFLSTQSRIDMLDAQIKELGGVPESPPTESTTTPATPPGPQPAPPAPAGDDPVSQAESRVDRLREGEPHPGVRLGPGNTVIGGTAEQLQENLAWRNELAQAEEALAVAKAERAFNSGGGLDRFSAADRAALDQKRQEIERLRAEDARVQSEIAPLERNLDAARRQLDGNRVQGGGPNAGGAGAIGAGEATNAALRPLYAEQARIRARIAELSQEIADLAKARIRTGVDQGGGTDAIDLPADRAGKHRVETELLRRVLERLGITGVSVDGTGTFATPRGSRRVPSLSGLPLLRVLAVAVVVALIALVVGVLLIGGDDETHDIALIDGPEAEPVDDQDDDSLDEPVGDATEDVADDEQAVPDVGPATRVAIAAVCPQVAHTPPAGSASLSQIILAMLLVGLNGTIPDGAEVTVDLGGDAPATSPVSATGLAEAPVGISSYGTYEQRSVSVAVDGQPIEVTGAIPTVAVDASEGPVGGCTRPQDLGDVELAALGDDARTTARIGDFLDAFDTAHAAGDAATLLGHLDRATTDRYGEDTCAAYLGNVVGTFADPKLLSARAEPWSYETDGQAEQIEDSWTVRIEATLGEARQETEMHLRVADDTITWFSDCGDPIGP